MNYDGKLFGKSGRSYIPLVLTSKDVDEMQRNLVSLRESLDDYAETVKNLEDVRDNLRTEIDRLKRELIIAYTPESRDDHDL